MDLLGKEKVFLIDGYPRNQDNINGWNEVFQDNYVLVCTLYLTCNEEVCIKRVLERGQSSGRSDDNEEVIKKRFNTFYRESLPVISELKKVAEVLEIDSTLPVEEVFEKISEEFDRLKVPKKI